MDWCTLTCSHIAENRPLVKEALKISESGKDKGLSNSSRAILLMASGSEVVPVLSDLGTNSALEAVTDTEFKVKSGRSRSAVR